MGSVRSNGAPVAPREVLPKCLALLLVQDADLIHVPSLLFVLSRSLWCSLIDPLRGGYGETRVTRFSSCSE